MTLHKASKGRVPIPPEPPKTWIADAKYTAYFEYLDKLREAGAIMFQARAMLMKEFRLTSQQATNVVQGWMQTYSPHVKPADRISKVKRKDHV